jgi:FKBP-type peptidyl-prolyl cis-trans isomerase
MKKLSILVTAAMLVMGMSFASCSKTSGSKMKTSVDSLSYAYGVGMGTNLAQNLEQFPAKLNVDLFLAVFEKALKGDTANLAITPQQAYEVFQRCLATAQQEAAVATKAEAKAFLEKNGKKDGVKTTASGLQYEVIKEGAGPKPTDSSTVSVQYHGTLLDGTVFDSSKDRGQPAQFPLNRVIKGWSEGIQLMNVGAKYKFWIPADLAYGDQGAGGKIKPGSLLVFEVELISILDGKTPAAPAAPAMPTK